MASVFWLEIPRLLGLAVLNLKQADGALSAAMTILSFTVGAIIYLKTGQSSFVNEQKRGYV